MENSIDFKTVMELMAVPGKSGEEQLINDVICKHLIDMGVPEDYITHDDAHKKSAIGGEMGNLIVHFPGHGKGIHKMFSTHMDTVPGAVGSKPQFEPENDRVINGAAERSLGADARAGVTCLLSTARALVAKKGDHSPCTLVFFVQEEIGLVGSHYLDTSLLGTTLPEMCFNFDGECAEEIVSAVIGAERMHIDLKGEGVHVMNIDKGISCASILTEAMHNLEQSGWVGSVNKDGAKALSNLGVLEGGTGSNVTMPKLYALMECRSFDLEFRDSVLNVWRQAFQDAVNAANTAAGQRGVEAVASVEFREGPKYSPYELPENHPAVEAAKAAVRTVGREPFVSRNMGGMDCANIVSHGIPAVGMGMGEHNAHAFTEWLSVSHFLDCCKIAAALIEA